MSSRSARNYGKDQPPSNQRIDGGLRVNSPIPTVLVFIPAGPPAPDGIFQILLHRPCPFDLSLFLDFDCLDVTLQYPLYEMDAVIDHILAR